VGVPPRPSVPDANALSTSGPPKRLFLSIIPEYLPKKRGTFMVDANYRTVFNYGWLGTEKSLAIPMVPSSKSIFPGKSAERCPNDFPIFLRRSKLDLEPILPYVR
jgi:hypothetical protein